MYEPRRSQYPSICHYSHNHHNPTVITIHSSHPYTHYARQLFDSLHRHGRGQCSRCSRWGLVLTQFLWYTCNFSPFMQDFRRQDYTLCVRVPQQQSGGSVHSSSSSVEKLSPQPQSKNCSRSRPYSRDSTEWFAGSLPTGCPARRRGPDDRCSGFRAWNWWNHAVFTSIWSSTKRRMCTRMVISLCYCLLVMWTIASQCNLKNCVCPLISRDHKLFTNILVLICCESWSTWIGKR